jgi:hypothetical protein
MKFRRTESFSFNMIILQAAIWLGYVNSMANPLIYGLMDKRIRSALKMFLWRASITAVPTVVIRDQGRNDSESSF